MDRQQLKKQKSKMKRRVKRFSTLKKIVKRLKSEDVRKILHVFNLNDRLINDGVKNISKQFQIRDRPNKWKCKSVGQTQKTMAGG